MNSVNDAMSVNNETSVNNAQLARSDPHVRTRKQATTHQVWRLTVSLELRLSAEKCQQRHCSDFQQN